MLLVIEGIKNINKSKFMDENIKTLRSIEAAGIEMILVGPDQVKTLGELDLVPTEGSSSETVFKMEEGETVPTKPRPYKSWLSYELRYQNPVDGYLAFLDF